MALVEFTKSDALFQANGAVVLVVLDGYAGMIVALDLRVNAGVPSSDKVMLDSGTMENVGAVEVLEYIAVNSYVLRTTSMSAVFYRFKTANTEAMVDGLPCQICSSRHHVRNFEDANLVHEYILANLLFEDSAEKAVRGMHKHIYMPARAK